MTAQHSNRPARGSSFLRGASRLALVGALSTAVVAGFAPSAFAGLPRQACTNGSAPTLGPVGCSSPGDFTLSVPANTGTVTIDLTGAGGAGSIGHTGGNGARITGIASLPYGTAYVLVSVGYGGAAGGFPAEGTASQLIALDGNHAFLAKIALAGAGGAGARGGNGGNAGISAGADGTSDDPAIATPGQGGSGPAGGSGGALGLAAVDGNAGQHGYPDVATSLYPGDGGSSRNIAGGGIGSGGGGDGYGAGGSGAAGVDASNVSVYAGGGGGSSYVSSYLQGSAATSISTTTGGAASANGVDGVVNLTFNAPTPPLAPSITSVVPADSAATVTFDAPASDGGSPISQYQVSTDGGTTWATVSVTGTGPMTVHLTGLTNGTRYPIELRAISEIGTGSPSTAVDVTPAVPVVPPVVVPPVVPPVAVTGTVTSRTPAAAAVTTGGTALVTCRISTGQIARCDVTLTAVVAGHRVVVGSGHAGAGTGRSATVTVRLDAAGRRLVNTVGGVTFTTNATIVAKGSSHPIHASGHLHLVGHSVAAASVYFDTASVRLTPADRKTLDALRTELTGVRSVTCDGFTDSRSNPAYNLALGLDRARAACAFLLRGKHITAITHTYGLTNPSTSNTTSAGRARNRHAAITLQY